MGLPSLESFGPEAEPMKTPISVRIIAVLFGMAAIAMAIGWISLYIRGVSQQPFHVQMAFVAIGMIVVGTPAWICLGLFFGSRDARVVTLALCWIGFICTPISILASFHRDPGMALGAGFVELSLLFLIYRVLTYPPIRSGFFRCPDSASSLRSP